MTFNSDAEFPGFSALFQVRDPFNRRAFVASLPDQGDPWEDAWIRGDRLPERMVRAVHEMGSGMPQPCVWTTSMALLLHEDVIDALTRAKLTGWTTYEVKLLTKKGTLDPAYRGFSVIGRCGPLDYSRGEWVASSNFTAVKGGLVLRGLGFDERSWDGSDFFAPATTGLLKIFCTQAGRDALGGFGNIAFRAMTDIEIEPSSLPEGVPLPDRPPHDAGK